MKILSFFLVAVFFAPVLLSADTVYLQCEVEIVERDGLADSIEGVLGDTSRFTVSLNESSGSVSHVYKSASNVKDSREEGVFSPSDVTYTRAVRLSGTNAVYQDFTIDRTDLSVRVVVTAGSRGFSLPAYVQLGKCEILNVGGTRKF